MNEELPISIVSVLQEIKRLEKISPEGFTITELSDASGSSQRWCRKQVRRLIKEGRVVFNGKEQRRRIDGVIGYVPVYKIKKSKKKK